MHPPPLQRTLSWLSMENDSLPSILGPLLLMSSREVPRFTVEGLGIAMPMDEVLEVFPLRLVAALLRCSPANRDTRKAWGS